MFKNLTASLASSGFVAFATALSAGDEAAPIVVPDHVDLVLDSYCFSCHDEDRQKGDLRLDQLKELSLEARLELLNKMQEQLVFGEMPPKKKKSQPTEAERKDLVAWISGELKKHDASTLEDKMRDPAYGNYVDHDKLFSGEIKEKAKK